jgi:hypothetical protein
MDPFSKQVGEKNTQRRTQRMLIGLPVSVVLARPNQKSILEHAKTLAVNAHGALILLAMKLFAGDPVTLINHQTDEQQLLPCRASRPSAIRKTGSRYRICEAFTAVLANRLSAGRLDTRTRRRQRVGETGSTTAKGFEEAMTRPRLLKFKF